MIREPPCCAGISAPPSPGLSPAQTQLRNVANLGLERFVLGKRTLQPCDTKCLRSLAKSERCEKFKLLRCTVLCLHGSRLFPGFCSVVLSPFRSQFSRAMAPSFKQVCAHTHILSLRCSPDSDISLLPAVLCQPPLQPATRLVDTEQESQHPACSPTTWPRFDSVLPGGHIKKPLSPKADALDRG